MSRRTETTQVFANPDGTWTSSTAPGPEFVQDGEGDWRDIDVTLVEREGAIVPTAAPTDLELSDGGDRVFAAMSESGRALEWRWEEPLPAPVLDGATATYEDVVEGGDLVVTATPTGFTHSVVLRKQPEGPVEFTIPVATDGANLKEGGAGQLFIESPDGEDRIVAAPRPVMWDALSEDDARIVDAEVSASSNGTAAITLTPDADFLSDPATVYPVTIDPIFSNKTSNDTWVSNKTYTASQQASTELRVGTQDAGTTSQVISRSFLRFNDIGQIVSEAPYNFSVASAALVLRNFDSFSCANSPIRVNEIAENWTVGALTWANQPAVNGRHASTVSAARGYSDNCQADDARWDVTGMVLDWYQGLVPNFGVRLKADEEDANRSWRRYRSLDYTNFPGLQPHLEIDYRPVPGPPTVIGPTPGSGPHASTNNPTFMVRVPGIDPNAYTLARIEFFSPGGSIYYGYCLTPSVTQWTPTGCALNGGFPLGVEVHYRAKGYNGHHWGGGSLEAAAGWSPWTAAYMPAIPNSNPVPDVNDPVVQQIVARMPGVTATEVIDWIRQIVADSGEDGITTPLTYNQAKQELLLFVQEGTGPLPTESSLPAAAGSACQWEVDADSNSVVVAREGVSSELTLDEAADDPTAPVYSAEINNVPVTVTVWEGRPVASIDETLASGAAHLSGLSAASLAGAVDGEAAEASETFSNPPQPSDGEPVAYRLETGGAVETGLADLEGSAGSSGSNGVDCLRSSVEVDDGVKLATSDGTAVFVPGRSQVIAANATAAYPSTSSAVRYRTFIPMAEASSGWVCGKFKGDDRGFTSHLSAPNRTRASVFFNWPSKTIDTTKHVGATHRLAGYGRSAKTKTASSAGIKFHTPMMSSTYGRIAITHSVGNPLCSLAGSIAYNVVVEAWKDGPARISGTRVRVPNHEAYYYPKTETYGETIFRRQTSKFYCLSINCNQEALEEQSG